MTSARVCMFDQAISFLATFGSKYKEEITLHDSNIDNPKNIASSENSQLKRNFASLTN